MIANDLYPSSTCSPTYSSNISTLATKSLPAILIVLIISAAETSFLTTRAKSLSTKGYLEIDLKLNQTNIKSKISTSSIYLYETLTLADTNGNTTNFTSPTVYVNYLNSDIPSTASSNSLNNEWKSEHLLDGFNDLVSDNGEIYISLKYELTPVSSVAYTRIYNYLTSSSTNEKLVLSLNLGEANA